MFQSLKLMATPSVYKQIQTSSGGGFVDGKYESGVVTNTYTPVDGFVQPYTRSESSLVLMSGVKSSESLYLFTNADLVVHNDLKGNSTIGDTIYLKDPTVSTGEVPYLCYDREPWDTNLSFTLIPQDYKKIILIRKEKFTEAVGV
tara:strand:+ start:570 stop:1004 length:435 start_codon:yes stop_codon:yes gene_type:complete